MTPGLPYHLLKTVQLHICYTTTKLIDCFALSFQWNQITPLKNSKTSLLAMPSVFFFWGVCLCFRLVEVNGVSVLGSSEDELELLLKTHIAHIIVLRQLAQKLPQEDPSALSDHQDIQVLKHQAM